LVRASLAVDRSPGSWLADLLPHGLTRDCIRGPWCPGSKSEISDPAFRVREDQPTRRVAAGLRKTF
jgi:hypothetical protein